MSGVEPIIAAEAATVAAGTAEAAAAAEALAAMEAAAAAEAATAAQAAAAAETATTSMAAMDAATAASSASSSINPYVMSSADKAAMLSNSGYGPGMSGFQTSVFDTTLGLTGSPQLAAALSGSNLAAGPANKALANAGTNMAMNAMRPRQQTQVSQQLRRGNPQLQMNQVAGLLDMAKRKRRPISLL